MRPTWNLLLHEEINDLKQENEPLKLEMKGLHLQDEAQMKKIVDLMDELHFYKRFRQIVERAAALVQGVSSLNTM